MTMMQRQSLHVSKKRNIRKTNGGETIILFLNSKKIYSGLLSLQEVGHVFYEILRKLDVDILFLCFCLA